jgi:hypothetical protein
MDGHIFPQNHHFSAFLSGGKSLAELLWEEERGHGPKLEAGSEFP